MPPVSVVPTPGDPLAAEAAKRALEKQRALKALKAWAKKGITLTRHVFFVPGWAGEEGCCWTAAYPHVLDGHQPIKYWVERIVRNPQLVRFVSYVQFTEQESAACPTFLQFADLLKTKIRYEAPADAPLDLVGHSMGGLDIIGALVNGGDYLRHPVVNAVTVGSPLRGVPYGNLVYRIRELLPTVPWLPHHLEQLRNMDHGAGAIRLINRLDMRELLLARVARCYSLYGTQDFVVEGNAHFRTEGLAGASRKKLGELAIAGAAHTGAIGITQDPRTAAAIFTILAGGTVGEPPGNQGILVGSP